MSSLVIQWTILLLVLFSTIPISHWLLFRATPNFLKAYRINFKEESERVSAFDLKYNLSTLVIIYIFGVVVIWLYENNMTMLYPTRKEPYVLFLVGEFIFLNVLQDTHFYWSHRWLHSKWLIKRVHSIHHKTTDPTPWTTLSFHPLEATLSYSYFLIIALLVPMHFESLVFYFIFLFVLNINGHLGFEIFPKNLFSKPFIKTFNNATHHQIHHLKSNCNFGLYYEFWDRWMGTENSDYRRQFMKNAAGTIRGSEIEKTKARIT